MTDNKLQKMSEVTTKNFLEKVQEQYVEKYAKDMVQLLDDQKRLQRSLNIVEKCIKEVEGGDFTAIDRYKKRRARLEQEEDGEL